jgi:membrane associated rhomboid family serine protease
MSFLKSFNRYIDRFCYRHPNFGIRNLMLFIIIGNAVIFLFSMMDTTGGFLSYLYLSPYLIIRGQIWRLVTFILVPESSNLLYLAIFLYFYYFIGSSLERQWGTGKFTVYYIFGMLLTVIYSFIASLATGFSQLFYTGAGYINLSMFFAFATLFPENRVLLFFIIPVKIKWLAYLDAAYFVVSMISGRTLLPLIGMLNYFLFCGDILLSSLSRIKYKSSRNVVNFQKAARQYRMQQEQAPYKRRCEVCGKTDTQYPDLDFRYCSRCDGYHCFCSEHINNHVHFKE